MFQWVSFLTYACITAVTPGPNNLMSMSTAGKKGFKGALPFNFGIWIGFCMVTVLCTAFCNVLSAVIPRIKLPMLIIGALYMLYLAWGTYRSSGHLEEGTAQGEVLSGLLLQFINPKLYIYCIVSMEAYILPHFQGQALPLLGFALLLASIGAAFTVAWAAFGSIFKWLFATHTKLVNTIMALLLVYCAISLFFT